MHHPEQRLQTTLASWLRWALPPSYYFTAIAHGSRGGDEAGRLRGIIAKDMGAKRGPWDLLIIGPERFVLWWEIKSRSGSLTIEQKAFGIMVRMMGHHTAVIRSWEDAKESLNECDIAYLRKKPPAPIVRALAAELKVG